MQGESFYFGTYSVSEDKTITTHILELYIPEDELSMTHRITSTGTGVDLGLEAGPVGPKGAGLMWFRTASK